MIDDRKKPPPDFYVRLVGIGVRPWTVPMRTLARVLDAIQRLVEKNDEDDEYPELPDEIRETTSEIGGTQFLRLIGLTSGSAVYAISAKTKDFAVDGIRIAGQAIERPDKFDWPEATISSVKDLSDAAKAVDCNIEFRLPRDGSRLGDVIAKITPNTFREISESAFVRGETSIFGTIERVGGAIEPRCAIRIPDQSKLIFCDVQSRELVKELATFLYQEVTLHGRASWIRHNWHIKYFNISSFGKPKTGSIRDALQRIRAAGGDAWDKVKDPTEEISKMRRA